MADEASGRLTWPLAEEAAACGSSSTKSIVSGQREFGRSIVVALAGRCPTIRCEAFTSCTSLQRELSPSSRANHATSLACQAEQRLASSSDTSPNRIRVSQQASVCVRLRRRFAKSGSDAVAPSRHVDPARPRWRHPTPMRRVARGSCGPRGIRASSFRPHRIRICRVPRWRRHKGDLNASP